MWVWCFGAWRLRPSTLRPDRVEPDPGVEGLFSATTPVSHSLPLTIKHPTACIVNVYGTLSKRGTELIKILQD